MKILFSSIACVVLWSVVNLVEAQTASSLSASDHDTPLFTLIDSVAKKTGKKFIIDPRVRAQVTLIGAKPESLDYPALLSVLEMNNFSAVEVGSYVRVLPAPDVRDQPVPTVVAGKHYDDSEVVTRVVNVKSVPVTQLLQVLRPLLPNFAHVGIVTCTNTLMIVDRFANVQRVAGLIEAMDKGEPYKPRDCAPEDTKK
ncbi:MAG TPA: secretin N-terminal domain-containing protein [Steroidobacteraceae bacterium]|nr:secretin N-terminal domain-containing protein [Steroidobacteraceae bacterium]